MEVQSASKSVEPACVPSHIFSKKLLGKFENSRGTDTLLLRPPPRRPSGDNALWALKPPLDFN